MAAVIPESTKDVKVPTNPVDMVIGQDEAVATAKIAAVQKRNLLLVGPPGTGKSMLAQAMASLLPKPTEEISVLDNPENPEKPILEVRKRLDVETEIKPLGVVMHPSDVPVFVAERLGYRCRSCASLSDPTIPTCSECGADKFKTKASPFDDILFTPPSREDKIYAVNSKTNGRVLYERGLDGVVFYDERALKELESRDIQRKVIVQLNRNAFVQATGASETELLGDIKHDPYGGHPDVGIKPYKRVLPGAIHLAHEGVLFIDEIGSLGKLQRHIFTAMQEKKFSIVGRNPTSSGAAVRVDNVPCDFILVGALNFGDMDILLPPLRSRILGDGYEVLLNTTMPDKPTNVKKLIQFIAQEIRKDGKIPHANKSAIKRIIEEARKRAKKIDGKNALTLRLRNLSGIIKLAGDAARVEDAGLMEEKHVEGAIEKAKTIEQQAERRYGNLWRTSASDYQTTVPEGSVI